MKRLVLGAAVAACAAGAAGHARAMDVFVEAGLGPVFESDVDVGGTAQTAEADASIVNATASPDVAVAVTL